MQSATLTNLNRPSVVSAREKEVLVLLSTGLASMEIAADLCLSYHTINDHRKALKQKLGARNVTQMIRHDSNFKYLIL